MTRRQYLLVIGAVAIVGWGIGWLSHRDRVAHAAGVDSDDQDRVSVLEREVDRLKQLVPDQAHAMTDVEHHFSNLWFAGQEQNWPLAEFYWKETLSHLRWAVRIIPVRKDSAGNEVKLVEILESIEKSPFMQMGEVIGHKNRAEFEETYRQIIGGCYSCHKASEKPYLRTMIPDEPASSIIQFNPNADWPK